MIGIIAEAPGPAVRIADGDQTLAAEIEQTTGRRAVPIAGDVGEESFCRDAVGRVVRELGRLDVVVGGEEGLAALCRERYDGLLIDGHLEPLPSGQPVFDALRFSSDGVPAIAVTGFKMPGDYERFIGLGYAGHIAKPFTGRRLLLLLESVLSGKTVVEEVG